MVTKIRPKTTIVEMSDMDGRRTWYDIDYCCPTCGKKIRGYNTENACENCGTFYDWGSQKPTIETIRTVQW